jgi:hypothetical protein
MNWIPKRKFLAPVCALAVMAVAAPLAFAADRVVMCEEFTATWCTYCPRAGQALSRLMDEFGPGGTIDPDTFTLVQYHSSDSYSTPFGNRRKTFYALTGTPLAWFDGVTECSGAYSTVIAQYNWYKGVYDQRHVVPTDITIEMSGTEIDADTYDVHVKVCMDPGGTAKTAKLYVTQVLDYYPASTPTIYRNTHMQTAVDDPAPISLTPGECYEVTYTFNFNAVSMAQSEDIKIVAWVQNPAASAPAENYQAAEMTWPFPSQSACPEADVNQDGVCDGFDVTLVRNSANWLYAVEDAAEPRCDVNGDGVIDGFDITIIRRTDCWLN